jgi:competence ComEA-like helix-hairpin-helix protein
LKLLNKPLWLYIWGAGIILWLIILTQFIVADNDTLILKQGLENNAPSPEFIVDKKESTAVVSSPVPDTVSIKKMDGSGQEEQNTTPGLPGIKDNCVNVNTASNQELVSLTGIGPVLADRIIVFREKNGNFAKASDLVKVKGIGEGKLKKIVNHICF